MVPYTVLELVFVMGRHIEIARHTDNNQALCKHVSLYFVTRSRCWKTKLSELLTQFTVNRQCTLMLSMFDINKQMSINGIH